LGVATNRSHSPIVGGMPTCTMRHFVPVADRLTTPNQHRFTQPVTGGARRAIRTQRWVLAPRALSALTVTRTHAARRARAGTPTVTRTLRERRARNSLNEMVWNGPPPAVVVIR